MKKNEGRSENFEGKNYDPAAIELKWPPFAKATRDKQSTYDPSRIEPYWQHIWEESGIYQPDLANAREPFYNLMMFPYPSAEGLHVGGIFTFTGVDVYGRFMRMQGKDVFEPIGLDGFGIHSENHAIKTGTHPMEHAKRTEENFYKQLHSIGNGYAWKNKVETYDPHYYKWTQWLFTELFKAGLAYRKKSAVNFCPWCKTVLADEQVIDGKCERCGTVVEKRELEQWFFKITEYADRLLKNINGLDWTEKVKIAQRNWIGKKDGMRIKHTVVGRDISFDTFTAYPAWSWADTFIVIAPEHPLVNELVSGTTYKKSVEAFITSTREISQADRVADKYEKRGIFTGAYAKDPFGGSDMPIWLANFALMDFGTGIIRCSAHDPRDYAFAQKYGIPLKEVVERMDPVMPTNAHDNRGLLKDSGPFTGKRVVEVVEATKDWIEEQGIGKRISTYHLRDWLISRQRYWGPPIPMMYCEACAKKGNSWFTQNRHSGVATTTRESQSGDPIATLQDDSWNSAGWYPVPEKDLPVKLPYVEDYKPLGTGESPLASDPEFYNVKCPICGNTARRETDVSDTFLDSAWYFFRYLSVDVDTVAFDVEMVKKWLPVNMYIGGAEHSVLHLLYARFMTMVLCDLGYIGFEEPFKKFYAHGLLIKDGAKMSKSRDNVINPDEYIKKFGADTLRCYLLFLGPFDQGGDFRDSGIEGMSRFLKRVWRLFQNEFQISNLKLKILNERQAMMHQTIKGMTEDLEQLRYNTAIAKLMSWYNFLVKQEGLSREEVGVYLQLLAPFAPHMTEELWEGLGFRVKGKGVRQGEWSIHMSRWPNYDQKFLEVDTVTIAIQVNGKLRGTLMMSKDESLDKEVVEKVARNDASAKKFLSQGEVKKVVYIAGKVINFVVA